MLVLGLEQIRNKFSDFTLNLAGFTISQILMSEILVSISVIPNPVLKDEKPTAVAQRKASRRRWPPLHRL